MRKILILFITLAMIMSLTGCNFISEARFNNENTTTTIPNNQNENVQTDTDTQEAETEPAVDNNQSTDNESPRQTQSNANEPFVVPLLAGWPIDLLPIHEDLSIMNTFFRVSVDEYDSSESGFHNSYLVGTRTREDLDPIVDYYRSLFDEITLEYDTGMNGEIGGYVVNVYYSEMDPYYLVYITASLPANLVVTENKYYGEFPGHLVELPDETERTSAMYSISDNRGGEYRYALEYATQMSVEDFLEFFTSRYEDKERFEFVNESVLRWHDEGYVITVNYSLDHGLIYKNVARYVLPQN